MSLINKMLQDLDARGGTREEGLRQPELKAVPATERDRRPWLLAGAAIVVLVLAAAAGWYRWQAGRATVGPVPQMTPAAAPLLTVPAAAVPPAPGAAATPVPQQASAAPQPAPEPLAPATAAPPRTRVAETAEAPAVRQPPAARPALRSSEPAAMDRLELTPKQLSDNNYRRALAALQEGRVSTALADLDRALEIDPRNEAARQTYVTLLLENRRSDDAIRQLRLALGIDRRQPGLAMVLARLQLERGGPALQTLMTTLPYAAANADYQAFLAGVLQREQRHAEAAQYYQAALKLAPVNGVWWMGLGISLQAEQQPAAAREAFSRARGGDGITPELLAFINRRLEQLQHAQP